MCPKFKIKGKLLLIMMTLKLSKIVNYIQKAASYNSYIIAENKTASAFPILNPGDIDKNVM